MVSCKIRKPIWFSKHYLNSAGYKESHRPAEEIMKKCEFQLESLSNSHYGDNVLKLFSIAGFMVLLQCGFFRDLPTVIYRLINTFIG